MQFREKLFRKGRPESMDINPSINFEKTTYHQNLDTKPKFLLYACIDVLKNSIQPRKTQVLQVSVQLQEMKQIDHD